MENEDIMKKISDSEIIDEIQKVRTKNNVCWMDILRIANRHASLETKEILRNISENDKQINELLNKLSQEEKK